jgi:hypothetical protein
LHGHLIGHFTPLSHTLNHYEVKPKGDIDGAIAAAEAQMAKGERLNLTKTAGEFGVERSTLSRRIAGKTRSWEEYLSQDIQHLTNGQEKALIKRINYLTQRHMPPTCQIVKNLAEEICGHCNGTRLGRIKYLEFKKLKNYSKNQGGLYTCPNRFRVSPDRVQG